MSPEPGSEHLEGNLIAESTPSTNLDRDILRNSLAFKGNSLDVFNNAVEEVKILTSEGNSVFPPDRHPSLRESKIGSPLQKTPGSGFVGRLTPAEAVGIRILQDESLALSQSYAINFDISEKINEILGTGDNAWQSDAIEGVAEFNLMIAMASGVRERMLTGQGEPARRSLGDIARLHWYKLFQQVLEQDKMKIGINTAKKAVEEIQRKANEQIPQNPEGARNDSEIKARIAGRIKGAELAEALYLEAVELAAKTLPGTLEPLTTSNS